MKDLVYLLKRRNGHIVSCVTAPACFRRKPNAPRESVLRDGSVVRLLMPPGLSRRRPKETA